jgi:rhodanese-related sulfurtransferase
MATATLNVETEPHTNWRTDLLRAGGIVAISVVLGFSVNALRAKPVPVTSSTGPGAMPEKTDRINVSDLQQLLVGGGSGVVLVDVRKEEHYREAHPLGAVSLPADDFTRHYGEIVAILSTARKIVILCESENCPLSDRVAARLKVLEHQNVTVLEGGWQKYQEASLPIVREAHP